MRQFINTSILLLCIFAGNVLLANDTSKTKSVTAENITDAYGHRQGYWRITGNISVEEGYRKNQLIEEGSYVDNKRDGLWTKYFPTGNIKSEITYKDNHPAGNYTVFYANGNVEEKGLWLANRNTGNFVRYYENGKVAQVFHFNSNGKRQGKQEYYYENGNLQMQVEVENGVLHGMYKTFYSDGSPSEEKRMTNGQLEAGSLVTYKSVTNSKVVKIEPTLPRSETQGTKDRPNLAKFKADGFNTLYNINKQVTQVGSFKAGRLSDGKWYRYDENGLLRRVEVYKNGRFIGYGIIEDSNN